MKMKSAFQGSVLAIAMVVAAGCASSSSIDALSARLDRVAADAKSASDAAASANSAAADAKKTASGAQSTANQALNAANQSQSCCDATNEKIDRMFKRSQAKYYWPLSVWASVDEARSGKSRSRCCGFFFTNRTNSSCPIHCGSSRQPLSGQAIGLSSPRHI